MPPRRSKRRRDSSNVASHDDAAAPRNDDEDVVVVDVDDVVDERDVASSFRSASSPALPSIFEEGAEEKMTTKTKDDKSKMSKSSKKNKNKNNKKNKPKKEGGADKSSGTSSASCDGDGGVPLAPAFGGGNDNDDDDNDDDNDKNNDDDDRKDEYLYDDVVPPEKSSLLSDLLCRITPLSRSKSRCTSALRAMVEGRVAYVASSRTNHAENVNEDEDDVDDTQNDDEEDGHGKGADAVPSHAPNLAASLSWDDDDVAIDDADGTSRSAVASSSSNTSIAASIASSSSVGKRGGRRRKDDNDASFVDIGGSGRGIRRKGPADAGLSGGVRSRRDGAGGRGGRRKDPIGVPTTYGDYGTRNEDGDGVFVGDDPPPPRRRNHIGSDHDNFGSDDAHLIMATTHAINVLLAYLLRKEGHEGACDGGEKREVKTTMTTGIRNAAIVLISLSSPLLTCLVNDRALLENITKARSSRPVGGPSTSGVGAGGIGSSSPSSRANNSEGGTTTTETAFPFVDDTEDELHGGVRPRGSSSPDGKSVGRGTAETRRIMMSHAKATVGRAMTSGVMGALYGLETLGKATTTISTAFCVGGEAGIAGDESVVEKGDVDGGMGSREDEYPRSHDAGGSVERAILRKCLWSGLMTLEKAFQLTSKPKLLATSSVSSSISMPNHGTFRSLSSGGCGTTTSSVIMYGGGMPKTANTTATSSSATAPILNFDYVSATNATANTVEGGNGSPMSSLGHAHCTMGLDTIAMWDALLARLLTDHEVGFQELDSASRFSKVKTGIIKEQGGRYAHDEKEATTENDFLAQICHDVTELVFADEEDSKFISLVLAFQDDDFSGNEPPTKMRKTSSTSTESRGHKKENGSSKTAQKKRTRPTTCSLSHTNETDYSELSTLLSMRIENHVSFDCHVSIRRWAVLAFGWLCSGQKRLLEIGAEILQHAEVWETVMALKDTYYAAYYDSATTDPFSRFSSSSAVGAGVPTAKLRTTKTDSVKSKISSTEQCSSFDESVADNNSIGVPGNLALIVFISAMIDTIYDAGATGGLCPPSSGWMDEYVKAVIGDSGAVAAVVDENEDKMKNETNPNAAATASSQSYAAAFVADSKGVRRSSRKRSKTNMGSNDEMGNKIVIAATAAVTEVGSPRSSRAGSARFLTSPRVGSGNLGSNKRGSTPLVWLRPDIRDLTEVLTKRLIKSHMKSLCHVSKLVNDDLTSDGGIREKRFVLVNDDDTFFGSPPSRRGSNTSSGLSRSPNEQTSSIHFYPFMHRTLETLGRTAASSAFLASSNDSKGKIIAIGSAVALGCFSQSCERTLEGCATVALDSKLMSMAVCELSECLGKVRLGTTRAGALISSSSGTTTSASLPQEIMAKYRLNEPLDVIAENSQRAVARQSVAASSSSSSEHPKGGENVISFSSFEKSYQAEILSIFIRAQIAEDVDKSPTTATCDEGNVIPTTAAAYTSAIASLIRGLLGILRICYDFDLDMHAQEMSSVESTNSSLHKKKSTTSKKKKRKVDEFNTLALEMLEPEIHPRKTFSRCTLAVGSLQALTQSVTHVADSTTSTSTSTNDHAIFFPVIRSCFSEDMMLAFVKLGCELEQKLIRPRLHLSKKEITTAARAVCQNCPSISSDLFEPWEHQLWAWHFLLSLSIGRGFMPCLDKHESRLQVFRAVVAVENQLARRVNASDNTIDATKRIDPEDQVLWPLNLTAVQHALISQMVIYSLWDGSSADDELVAPFSRQPVELQFLCHSFLKSLEEHLSKTSGLTATTTEDGLLSLRDARLFTLAVTKLSRFGQKFMLSRLIGIIHRGLQYFQPFDNADSGLIARGISLCTSVADIVVCPDLETFLLNELEATRYPMPRLKPQYDDNNETPAIFHKEYFQSIFASWQSPIPPIRIDSSIEVFDDKDDYKMMASTIVLALTVGFQTAKNDGCHLLFSGWNAAAKLSSWTSISWDGPASATVVNTLSAVERIMRLRVDMCELHKLMQASETFQDYHNESARGAGQSMSTPHKRHETLLRGLHSAEKVLLSFTAEISEKSHISATVTPSLEAFAFFEALPLFISFIISMHCRPGPNDMNLAQRMQPQKITSASSSRVSQPISSTDRFLEESDLEICNTTSGGSTLRMNALTRLHEACLELGAAPCYPDWLDSNCRMSNGILPVSAVDSASSALLSLTEFGMKVWRSYLGAMRLVLGSLNQTEISIQGGNSLALQLFFAQQQHPADLTESFYSQVESFCGINGSLLSFMVFSLSSKQCLAGNAFVNTSAHKIPGAEFFKAQKVFMGERRANGQWETLLSEVLQGSSLTIHSSLITNLADDAVIKQIVDALTSAHRWQRVLYSIVNAMVPTAALLRFGISDGKGRNTHTLCEELPMPGNIFSSSSGRGSLEKLKKNDKCGETICTNMKEALSFLACVAAYSPHDDDIRLTSRAAAGHLLENSSQFNDLTALWSAMVCCDSITDVMCKLEDDKSGTMPESRKASAFAIIEMSLTRLSSGPGGETDTSSMPIIALKDSLDMDKRTLLLSLMGVKHLKVAKIIGTRADIELTEMSTKRNLSKLLPLAFAPELPTRSRILVTEMLFELMDAECDILKQGRKVLCKINGGGSSSDVVRVAVASALDELSTDEVRDLVKNLVGDPDNNPCEETLRLSKKTATVISFLASVSQRGVSGRGCKIILEGMTEGLNQWAMPPSKHHMISLFCLLASRFETLDVAGGIIVSLLKQDDAYIETARDFFECVSRLDRSVNKESHSNESTASLARVRSFKNDGVVLTNGKLVSRTCSFVETGEGFSDQHWYNCYTCGLLWDKGCCSLCARVCHKGHDIGYSRKSSFFCDCGAEVAVAIEQNRTPCKCLTPVSDDIIRAFYGDELEVIDEVKQAWDDFDAFAELMAKYFLLKCKESLKNLVDEAIKSDWRESILLIFNQTYQSALASGSGPTDFSAILSATSDTQPFTGVRCPNLLSRSAQPLTIKRNLRRCMVPIRAAKASSLQSRIISGSSAANNNMRKTRNDYHLQAIASDNRGRLYIAESTSILFCSSISSVNVRYVENSPASHLSRSQLSILGTDRVSFAISGMALNSENGRHLLVWGVAKACVCIVSKTFDSFERIIDLKLNLEPSEECEYLLKCEWIPHSELHIVAVCGAVVHVFDLKRTENNTCDATTHYALAYEDVLIRSATLLGSLSVDNRPAIEAKVVLLLDTGRLYFISLKIDEEGNLEDHGESYIEIGAGFPFPSAGIRRYSGGEPNPKGSNATTFGDGAYLAHLRLANILLYQCVSSCCIAMLLDDDGAICGSFELLPNMISSDDFGGNYDVVGPYTHFQELGIAMRDNESFFRVACIGRSTKSSQPTALIMEFNENSVFVSEVAWPTNCSAGLGIISAYNFIGSCTFSCPYLSGSNEGLTNRNQIHERAILTLLTSSGSLLWFGEDCDHLPEAKNQHMTYIQNQTPNIGFFESLINASDLDALIIGGECAGKDPSAIKKKLSLSNTDYVTCPSRDGCTLTACLQVTDDSSKYIRSLAIVAVRILVGSMPDLIPKEIIIMGSGRIIKLKKNVKRWYDFPLTDEETLLAVRNGFVTIWISPCHDSSSAPIIDSVEVYARAKSELSDLSPDRNGGDYKESLSRLMKRDVLGQHSNLVTFIQSLSFLTQITGWTKMGPLSADSKKNFCHIIRQTALNFPEEGSLRDQTIRFLYDAEEDVEKRTFLVDEATLRGLMSLLQKLGKYLQTEFANVDIVSSKQEMAIIRAIEVLVHILISTTAIAQARGGNYGDIIGALITEKTCMVSMALEGKKILDLCQYFKATLGANIKLFQPAQVVSELLLTEIACFADKPFAASSNFIANFDSLAAYLTIDSTEIVKACCAAISNAIGIADTKAYSNITHVEQELSGEVGAVVTYQCDSCLVFPITGLRFTLGGEMDIDLCKRCYDLGIAYSKTAPSPSDPLIINGRTLCVENEDMTCGKIWQMTSKPIAESSLEQAKNAKNLPLKICPNQSMEVSGRKLGCDTEVVKTEDFRSRIFTYLLGLMAKTLDASAKDGTSPPSLCVLQLLLEIVFGSCTEDLKAARGKDMALAFTKKLPNLVEACRSSDFKFSQNCSKLVVCLRTLVGLVVQNQDSRSLLLTTSDEERDVVDAHYHNHKKKTDPRFVCEHGPAVRRRCSHGVHKDRRFYVCGLDRNKRCNFFKWATDTPKSSTENDNQQVDRNEKIFIPVQMEIQRFFSTTTLQVQFCSFVSDQFDKDQVVTSPEVTHLNDGASITTNFPSIKTELEKLQDKDDGIYSALEKFGKSKPIPSKCDRGGESSFIEDGTRESFLCSSLDLLSLIAPTTGEPTWCDDWFSVLCEIISRNSGTSTTVLRLARSMLQRLCGGRQEVYHRVRDHYVFGIQYRKLFQHAAGILDAALVVCEQSRACGTNWRDDEVMFDTLPASGLLGIEDLISEDEYKTSTEEAIETVLDELLSAAVRADNRINTRSNSWRKFCGLPGFQATKGTSAPNSVEWVLDMLDQIYHRPPIVSLMWLSSSLRGSNQVKALALVDIALIDKAPHVSAGKGLADDVDSLLVGGYQTLDDCPSDPEECLKKGFTVHDLFAFIKQFVVDGRSKQLRAISAKVARKLSLLYSPTDKQHLFKSLIGGPFQKMGALGLASKNFIDLLVMFVDSFGLDLDVSAVSSCITSSFISQMTVLNEAFSLKDSDTGSLSCSLSNCVHCQKPFPPKKAMKSTAALPDQAVRPFQRDRLELSTAASISCEFSLYNQLKFRLALSEVHVAVSDPRGRLVKSIGVYFSPRQVSDVAILKSQKYQDKWQRCGTLSLARGASEASFKLKHPVVAANLKFTYEEFYEKASNKRAADGSFILYCPRCTRQVHNAHGVCGNCGEVAFQCRKCRHINYDNLDAFLCVECGYCTAGSFSYELTAGIALNAIAILDEDGFQRSIAMLRVANKRRSELMNSLKKKLMAGIQEQRKNRGDQMENLDEMMLYGPHLKRALLGGMPKSDGIDNDDDSTKKSGSSRSKGSTASLSERVSSSSSRARDLLSLARSLRAEGSDGLGSRGDLLRQALLSAGSSGPLGLDTAGATDLLSALSANIHARARDGGGGGDRGKSDGKDDKVKLSPVEEKNRLYSQMREAERECYELNRRIDAWNRLNNNCLTGSRGLSPPAAQTFQFLPSTCPTCSMHLSYQMISLLYSVYATANVEQYEHAVSSALIKILLKESQPSNPKAKDLNKLKRRVVVLLASASEVGSGMILSELKLRLTAVQDTTSAEILGTLVQMDFPSVDKYIQLALDVLQDCFIY